MITYGTEPTRGERGPLHVSATSGGRAGVHRSIRLRAQAPAQRQLAALEQQRQLIHRQLDRTLTRPLPRRREVTRLQTLAQKAQAGAVEVQRLRPLARPTDEDEDVPREQALLHGLDHERRERVVRLAHVHRLPVDEHPHATTAPEDHDILRNSAASLSTSSPSITSPLGACATRRLRGGGAVTATATDATRAALASGALTCTTRNPALPPARLRSAGFAATTGPRSESPSCCHRHSVVS